MSINQAQITPTNGVAQNDVTVTPTPAQSMTKQVALMRQVRTGITFQSASVFCRTYTATLSAEVGYVPVGGRLADVTLAIAATVTAFKLNSAVLGLASTIDPITKLATIVQKAITDNLPFSSAYTINVGVAAGQFWGAFRVQMDALGVISTKAYAQDQAFLTEADAIRNCPVKDSNKINLGTITVLSATGAAFTCNTTALNAAGTTVNYNGATSSFTLVTVAAMTFVAATIVQGTMSSSAKTRTMEHPGGLVVVRYTSDGSMVVTDPEVNFNYRPYPMNNEAPFDR